MRNGNECERKLWEILHFCHFPILPGCVNFKAGPCRAGPTGHWHCLLDQPRRAATRRDRPREFAISRLVSNFYAYSYLQIHSM